MKFALALALVVCAAYAQVPNGPNGRPAPPVRPPPPPPQQQCRSPGETFVQCSYPDGTCSQPVPLYCPLTCGRPACQCRPGWVRNAQNTCIPVARCPQVGGSTTAGTGATTPSTTTSSSTPSTSSSKSTTLTTANGTTVSGLPTLPTGIANCAEGEMFTLCSTAEATCTNLVPTWPRQQLRYGPPKCQCLPGYVRQNGTCVPLATCFAGVTGPTTTSTPTTTGNITLPIPPVPVAGPVGK